MTGRGSLQRRLGVGLAIAVTALWLAATAGFVIRHELDEAFDSALQETAQRQQALAVIEIVGRDDPYAATAVAAIHEHEEFLIYLVRDPQQAILLQSHEADPAAFPELPAPGFHEPATHQLYGEAAVSGTILIEGAEPLAHRRRAVLEAVAALFLPLALLVPVSLFGVWWFVRTSLRPVLTLKADIESLGGGDLTPVPTDSLPAEIGPIAEAVNRLFERLRRALEAERSFAANSAHERRTPIAAMLAQTQRLIAEAPKGAGHDRARRIETSLRRLARLSEKLMELARAEGGGLVSATPHDLALVLVHVVDESRRNPEIGKPLLLTMPAAGKPLTRIGPDAFAVLIRNLVDNALKHGRPDRPVAVTLSEDGSVRVVNGGAVEPAETLAGLKGRFARGAGAAEGAGLGLAIAEAIATGAGGSLHLRSPATGRDEGFEVLLRLPR